MSITAPTMFTTNLLIADSNYTLNGTEEILATPTTAACGIELQSTSTALCVSRLTQAQINGLAGAGTATNGMIAYNTTTNAFNYYANGNWTASSGAGAITTPGVTTVNAVVLWGNNVGTNLLNSTVLIDATGDITGVGYINSGNGTLAAPTYAFTNSTNTGMFRSAAHTIDFATNGLEALQLLPIVGAVNWIAISPSATTTPVKIAALGTDGNININLLPQGTGAVQIPVGTAANPTLVFTGSLTTGMFSSAGNTIDFATNGLEALQILPVAGAVNWLSVSPSATTTPVLLSANGTDVNIGIQLVPKGTGSVFLPNGAVGTPAIAFANSISTGMFRSAANTIDFATNGLEALQLLPVATAVNWLAISPSATTTPVLLSAKGTDVNIGIQLTPKGTGGIIYPVGAVGTPSITFTGDLNTGLYHVAADVMGVTIGGTAVGQWSATGISIGQSANSDATPPTNTISIANGTAPAGAAPAATIELYSTNAQSNALTVTTLGLAGHGAPAVNVQITAAHLVYSMPIVVNGTTYYIPLSILQS